MSMTSLKENLDRGTHHDAVAAQQASMAALAQKVAGAVDRKHLHQTANIKRDRDGDLITDLRYLTAYAESEGVGPTDAQLAAHESYWLKRLGVRPWEHRREEKVKAYARDRWAMDAIMVDSGVNIKGPLGRPGAPSVVQKAYETTTTQVIFPFFYSAAIQAGILATQVIDRLIMEEIPVNSHTADHVSMRDGAGDRSSTLRGEGSRANEIVISANNEPIKLKKFMSKALASYEGLRLQRVPVFEMALMRVGKQLMIDITDLGVETLIAGDGNTDNGAAATVPASASKNYADVLALEFLFTMGYDMEDGLLLADKAVIKQLLNMAEFKDPLAGGRYAMHGEMPTPVGHPLLRWDYTGKASSYATTKLVHLKPGLAMVKYTEGGLLVETDKIIDGQWDVSVASIWTNFGIWDRNACKVSTGW